MQDILAIVIVLAAAAFLVLRMWQSVTKRRTGCGACSNCPSNSTVDTPSLVNIGPIMSHATGQRREDFDN
jgi:hypothetical protein